MNILYGINTPTNGEVYVKGRRIEHFSPKAAIERGVGMVHQHFMLVPSFTVAQNIVLSREPRRLGVFFDNATAERETRGLVEEYGLEVDPAATVRDISVGLQQRVEILKTLYRGADILILDEPTAVLTPQETDELFDVIRRIVREKQMTVIIITHKLYEVMAISDRVGVMRQGRLAGLENTRDVNEKILASMMVGRPVLFDHLEKTGETGDVVIGVEDPRDLQSYTVKVAARDLAVVTSGDYQRYFTLDGVRYHHLIDPETRYPAQLFRAVTVVGADSGVADMLSTALFLLPQETGAALLKKYDGYAAMWTDADGKQIFSDNFESLLYN